MLASLSRTARFKDQLQLDDEVNSEIADGYATGSSARRGVAVGDLPTSSVSAPQLVLEQAGSARTHPVYRLFKCQLYILLQSARPRSATYRHGYTALDGKPSGVLVLTIFSSVQLHDHTEGRPRAALR
eukprot:scaffold92632_cov52-Phaeocystis_antarctica.AAC.1